MGILTARLERLKAHRAFAVLACIFSLPLCFLTAPYMVADEGGHFYRAYAVSEGSFMSERFDAQRSGGFLPRSLLDGELILQNGMPFNPSVKVDLTLLRAALTTPLNPDDRAQIGYPGQSLYSPMPYVAAAFGIAVARQFDVSPVILMLCGRLCTCLAAIALFTLAIKVTPVQKWTMASFLLIPLIYFQSASLSADALTNAFCVLFVAVCWRLCLLEEGVRATRADVVLAAAAGLGVCLTKQAYFPLLALLALVPASAFGGGQARKWRSIGLIAGVGLVAMVIWAILAQQTWTPVRLDIRVDPRAQLKVVLEQPFHFLEICWQTLVKLRRYFFASLLGGYLSYLDIVIPLRQLRPIAWVICLAAILEGTNGLRIPWRLRSLALTLSVGLVFFVMLLQYLSWNPIGADSVDGPSGRYAVPMLPLITIVVAGIKLGPVTKIRGWIVPLIVIVGAIYSGVLTIVNVVDRFYGI